MNTEKMKCFVDVVKYNSFTKAAEANYLTQAAVSQQISSIEEELGLKCFERTKNGIVISEGGQTFYKGCLELLATYSKLLSQARCVAHDLPGYISLGLWPGLDRTIIFSAIEKLIVDFPGIKLDMKNGTPVDFWYKLNTSKLAAAILLPYDYMNPSISGEIAEPLGSCGFDLCISEKNPLARFDKLTVNQIKKEKMIVVGEENIGAKTYSHIVVEQMQNKHGLRAHYIVPNLETQQMMVAVNRGIMLQPRFCCFPVATHVKRIPLVDYPETVDFSLFWNPVSPSPGLKRFVKILKASFPLS